MEIVLYLKKNQSFHEINTPIIPASNILCNIQYTDKKLQQKAALT